MCWKKAWNLRKKSFSSLEAKTRKKNKGLTPPTTTSPKCFGNTYLFEQKSEKIMKQQEHYHCLLLSKPLFIHHKLNLLYLKQNQ